MRLTNAKIKGLNDIASNYPEITGTGYNLYKLKMPLRPEWHP